MNYSDFEEIEQDEWSLTRPVFPTSNTGTLTVIGFCWHLGSSRRRTKQYIVECNICKKDRELHGEGLYKSFKKDLIKGRIPCGCSNNPRFTRGQWEVRVKRSSEEKGLKFISLHGEFKGGMTKLEMSCPKHGSWFSTTAESLICNNPGCPSCGRIRTTNASKMEDSWHVKKFLETEKFHKGTIFWRSDKNDSPNHWFYKCPVCSVDEYAKAGLCEGVFGACHSSLKKGMLPCRCSKSVRLTASQWEYKINKDGADKGYVFVKWLSKPGRFSKFQYKCRNHGLQQISVDNYMRGRGCPECAGQDQRQCYINQVLDQGLPVAIKFGITRHSGSRIQTQNARNLFEMRQLGVWMFPSSKSCKDAENECKKVFDCCVLTKRELKDGWTETTSIKNIDKAVEIYENFGGKRIA